METTLEEALKLPITERIKLVDDIWDSINVSPDAVSISPEQQAELARRLEDYEKNPGGNFSWEEVKAEAVERYDLKSLTSLNGVSLSVKSGR